jgi:hypothetical protein
LSYDVRLLHDVRRVAGRIPDALHRELSDEMDDGRWSVGENLHVDSHDEFATSICDHSGDATRRW